MKKAKDQPESEPAELASLVGERIRKIRKEEGLSLELFALRCDMNAAYVGHIERGVQNPTLNTLERICKGLDISVEDLFIDMLFTDVQRSVRLNKKKKSTNTSPYPDEIIDRLARAFYPAILACWNSEEGQRSLVGARPLHLANARPFGRLKAPLGLSLLRCAAQTRACLWQAEQAHHANNEKQEVPTCWVSVKQFSKNDTATACQDWLRSTRLGRGSIKSHVRTVKVLGMGLFAFQERIHLWKGVTH